jgi:hypothetical protein
VADGGTKGVQRRLASVDELIAAFTAAANVGGVEAIKRVIESLLPATSGRLDAALISAVELTSWAAKRGNATLCLRATEDGLRLMARRRALLAAVDAVQLLRDPWSNSVDIRRALALAISELESGGV